MLKVTNKFQKVMVMARKTKKTKKVIITELDVIIGFMRRSSEEKIAYQD